MSAPAGNRGRASFDPFHPAGPAFPERRLIRAGVDEETVARLRDQYTVMGADEQRELSRFVARNPDSRIVDRYQGTRSREDLEEMTVAELTPLLRQRHLSTGHDRKAELVDRLLTSYGTPSGALSPTPPPAQPDTPDAGPEAASGDDTAGNAAPAEAPPAAPAPAPAPEPASPAAAPAPESTPDTAPTTPAAPAAPVDAPATQAPGPQTPDATPAPATAAPAATTTQEATRG